MQPEHFDALAHPADPGQFAAALEAVCEDAGLAHYLVIRLCGPQLDEVIQTFHNAPANGGGAQALHHWTVARMLQRMRRGGPPVLFGEGAEPAIELPGYASGVAVLAHELRGGSVFYFGGPAAALAPGGVMKAIHAVLMAATYGIHGLARLHVRDCPLSEGELQCLRLFVKGQSAKEIAKALSLSSRTVEGHLSSVRKRLGADTTLAAVYKAINHGWLGVPMSGDVAATG